MHWLRFHLPAACVIALLAPGVCLAQAVPAFRVRQDFRTGAAPHTAASALINDDPYVDIVVADDRGVSVLFGSAGGRLSAPLVVDLPTAATDVAVADFDGDSHADFTYVGPYDAAVHIRYGDGLGNFVRSESLQLTARPSEVFAEDLDRDGDSDIVVGVTRGIAVLLSDGDGFQPARISPIADPYSQLILGDFDGDDRLDAAALSPDTATLAILAGDGKGNFAAKHVLHVESRARQGIARDLSGDGVLDLAVADSVGLSVLLGQGDGNFRPPLRVRRSLSIDAVAVAEVNGDDNVDLAIVDSSHQLSRLFFGDGRGAFRQGPAYDVGRGARGVIVADLTGDRHVDLVTINRDANSLTLLAGDGAGHLTGAPVLEAGSDPIAVAVADLNGDGHGDLVTANEQTGEVTVLLGNGRGAFVHRATVVAGRKPRALLVAHLDSDRILDIAVANWEGDNVAVLAGDGTGKFAAPLLIGVGGGPVALTSLDINHDDHLDLVVANNVSDSVSLLYADGEGRFPQVVNAKVGPQPSFLMTGDFDNDQMTDLLIGSSRAAKVEVMKGTGTGLAEPQVIDPGAAVRPSLSADLNGDGMIDLVIVNQTEDRVTVLPGTGPDKFGAPLYFPTGPQPDGVASGDLNEDSKPDLAVASRRARTVLLLLNTTTTKGKSDALAAAEGSGVLQPTPVAGGTPRSETLPESWNEPSVDDWKRW